MTTFAQKTNLVADFLDLKAGWKVSAFPLEGRTRVGFTIIAATAMADGEDQQRVRRTFRKYTYRGVEVSWDQMDSRSGRVEGDLGLCCLGCVRSSTIFSI